MATRSEELVSVQAAIAEIEAGSQLVEIGDAVYRAADIDKLYAREKDLRLQTSRVAGYRPLFKRVNMGGIGYS